MILVRLVLKPHGSPAIVLSLHFAQEATSEDPRLVFTMMLSDSKVLLGSRIPMGSGAGALKTVPGANEFGALLIAMATLDTIIALSFHKAEELLHWSIALVTMSQPRGA